MNVRSGKGEADGKVILFGEHAVVWGTRALACALPGGMVAVAEPWDAQFSVSVPNWRFEASSRDDTLHGEALRALVDALPFSAEHANITIDTQLVPRAGLGASAAFAASVARALAALSDVHLETDTLFAVVQASERVFHGTPSGLDATLAIRGGTVVYTRSSGGRGVDLPVPELLIVHSGEPGDTRRTVERFAARMRDDKNDAHRHLRRIDDITEEGIDALSSGDDGALGRLMVENHRLLAWFGVSTPELDHIVDIALDSGALGAKLTGGGGGGCAIILPGNNSSSICRRLATEGYKVLLR